MTLKVTYDDEVDAMHISTGLSKKVGDEVEPGSNVIVHYGSDDGFDIAALEILSVSDKLAPYFLPQSRKEGSDSMRPDSFTSYDEETDTLTWGTAADNPDMIARYEDSIVVYLQWDLSIEYLVPVGVSLRGASKHLAPFFRLAEGVGGDT